MLFEIQCTSGGWPSSYTLGSWYPVMQVINFEGNVILIIMDNNGYDVHYYLDLARRRFDLSRFEKLKAFL